ncbi:amidohydrolase family protein [Aureibacter tunicatorum]|uniref:Imidazolonepropionase-like amidohydrolase n=1 Tax=Aureibacter tunicatorum TaxID=866807 RepID=A0AAE4BSJ5_9BACT|nr:amidohydrolase family protein [Aureibacter tunicatorum]MDR6238888.1 imidazolonepropionase-like amidohydrolase [Aureibacter tunicatorum]BDD05185.1 hypothetical protein AUTU_26680 [Aureibacter tunicatorum]
MKRLLLILLLAVVFFSCDRKQYDLAVSHVDIFDSESGSVIKNKTILISHDSIAKIIDADENFSALKVIEGNGRLASPGFVDTHIHFRQMLDLANRNAPKKLDATYRKKLAEKLLAYGTTTALDMAQYESWIPTTVGWQNNPDADFPNYYITGAGMISKEKRNPAPHHAVVLDPKKKVASYYDQGVRYVKIYSHLNDKDASAVVKEAGLKNMKVFAHTDHNRVTIQEAMAYGVRNFEHFFTVIPSILEFGAHREQMEESFGLSPYDHIDDFAASMAFYFSYIKANKDLETKLLALFDEMAQNNASMSTTIHILAAAAGKTDVFSSFNHFPIRENAHYPDYTDEQRELLKQAFDDMMSYLKIAHDKGVKIRIGTDNREAGQSMISELYLLGEAGFSSEEVLQIATWNGAESMGIENEIGVLKQGSMADLIIFEKSPLENIENFNAEKIIIKGGKVFDQNKHVQVETALNILKNEGEDKAVRHIQERVETFEAYELVEIAYHLFHIGEIKSGEEVLGILKSTYPDFKEIYYENAIYRIGRRFARMDQIDKTVEIYKLNTEKFPNSSEAFTNLAYAYEANDNKKLAMLSSKKAVELNPENENAQEIYKKLEATMK